MRGPGEGATPAPFSRVSILGSSREVPPQGLTKPLSEIRGHESLWRQGVQPTYTRRH